MTIKTVSRPYMITFAATGTSYSITSADAQRVIDEYPAVRATRNRVVLRSDDAQRVIITPATIGGGPAFIID